MENQETIYPIENLEKFISLLHNVQRVTRVARRPDEKELTNTAEHTFELALLCWYIVSVQKLNLNLEKVLQYALAHDLIEAYAGDTPIHDEEAKKTKVAREAAALIQIEQEFPEFGDLLATIHEYELRDNPESRFVYAADKLVDPLSMSMETTQSIWKDYAVSFDTLLKNKTDKIAFSDVIQRYWNQLLKKLESKKSFFFDA